MEKDLAPLKSTMYRNIKIKSAEKLLLIKFNKENFNAESCSKQWKHVFEVFPV